MIIGLKNQFLVFLRVAILDRFYCIILQESFYLVYPSAIASVASCKIVQTEVFFNKINEPRHEISNNVVCVTSKGSDQPAHTGSPIRAFTCHLNILWLLSYWPTLFGVSKLKRRLCRLVWVYTCQNATLFEITCRGSFVVYYVVCWNVLEAFLTNKTQIRSSVTVCLYTWIN